MLLKLRPDVVLADLMLQDGTACDLLQKLQAKGIVGQVLVYTRAYGRGASARDAARRGQRLYHQGFDTAAPA